MISDLDAPILLQKKNDENYFANIIINYYTGEEYLNRVNNFLKITFPKLHYLDQFRKHIFNIYNDDFYIGVLECKNGLRKEGIGCVIPSNIKEEYKKNQKAAAYAFADQIRAAFPKRNPVEITLQELPANLCCHIGPEALAIACSKRIDIPVLAEQVIAAR